MIIVSSFQEEYNTEKDFYVITGMCDALCPLCDGELAFYDRRRRDSKNLNGEVRHYHLRRLRCTACAKLHTEIPDTIQPLKHYDSATIQSVLDGSEEASGCAADDSTIRRWKRDFGEAEPDIEQRVSSVCVRESDAKAPLTASETPYARIRATEPRWLAFVIGLLINAGYRILTRFAFCPPSPPAKVDPGSTIQSEGGKDYDKTITDTG